MRNGRVVPSGLTCSPSRFTTPEMASNCPRRIGASCLPGFAMPRTDPSPSTTRSSSTSEGFPHRPVIIVARPRQQSCSASRRLRSAVGWCRHVIHRSTTFTTRQPADSFTSSSVMPSPNPLRPPGGAPPNMKRQPTRPDAITWPVSSTRDDTSMRYPFGPASALFMASVLPGHVGRESWGSSRWIFRSLAGRPSARKVKESAAIQCVSGRIPPPRSESKTNGARMAPRATSGICAVVVCVLAILAGAEILAASPSEQGRRCRRFTLPDASAYRLRMHLRGQNAARGGARG